MFHGLWCYPKQKKSYKGFELLIKLLYKTFHIWNMEKIVLKMKLSKYEEKIEFLEKKNLEMSNARLSEKLSNVTY